MINEFYKGTCEAFLIRRFHFGICTVIERYDDYDKNKFTRKKHGGQCGRAFAFSNNAEFPCSRKSKSLDFLTHYLFVTPHCGEIGGQYEK